MRNRKLSDLNQKLYFTCKRSIQVGSPGLFGALATQPSLVCGVMPQGHKQYLHLYLHTSIHGPGRKKGRADCVCLVNPCSFLNSSPGEFYFHLIGQNYVTWQLLTSREIENVAFQLGRQFPCQEKEEIDNMSQECLPQITL